MKSVFLVRSFWLEPNRAQPLLTFCMWHLSNWMKTWIKLIGCFHILWKLLIINQREQKPLHHHLIMGEQHLAGSTHRMLIGVFLLLSAACLCVCVCFCVCHASICYLRFCLITFSTTSFDYSKQKIFCNMRQIFGITYHLITNNYGESVKRVSRLFTD